MNWAALLLWRAAAEVIATAGGRTAELVEAQEREVNGYTFYDLEYAVHLKIATATNWRPSWSTAPLYTLATSVNEDCWNKVNDSVAGRPPTESADLIIGQVVSR